MPGKTKICHIQLLPLMSGVQRSMLDILCRLDKNRYDIYVICRSDGDLVRELERLGMNYILLPSLVRQINPVKDITALVKLVKIFTEYKFDIVHTHSSKTGFLGRMAARLSGVPQVFHTVHGMPFHEFSHPLVVRIYSFLERFGARFATGIIFVNHEERLNAIKKRLVREGQAVTVYNGVDPAHYKKKETVRLRKKIRAQLKLPPYTFVVGYVGRLWKQKGPETLRRIVSLCREKDIRFLIVGDGPHAKYFKDLPNVTMTGWVDHPEQYYPAFDVVVLPSLWEGLSMTLIEAMGFGKPLIASDIKGNRECVWHGENGFLCPPQDAGAYQKAILKLKSDGTLYRKMSRYCFEKIRMYFDINKNVRQIINLYETEKQL
ncbi:glycosyltransferase family 4 protein [candidate division KSB1 bacterium]|nr:glycosyltransferase family 4 protein [candidate division KSB1 bacterium]